MALLAWVKENNPKQYIPEGRLDKTRQTGGDRDCKLGVKKRRNATPTHDGDHPAPTTDAQPAAALQVGVDIFWGYASGVVATRLPDGTEVVLAERTRPFNESDPSYFHPLMAQVEERLGRRPAVESLVIFKSVAVALCRALKDAPPGAGRGSALSDATRSPPAPAPHSRIRGLHSWSACPSPTLPVTHPARYHQHWKIRTRTYSSSSSRSPCASSSGKSRSTVERGTPSFAAICAGLSAASFNTAGIISYNERIPNIGMSEKGARLWLPPF
jgi:hypothetical protein